MSISDAAAKAVCICDDVATSLPYTPSPLHSPPLSLLLLPPQVRFLEYIRQWRKKVVFVVNKVDMLGSAEEVEEVKR